jgi:hypothetical protein
MNYLQIWIGDEPNKEILLCMQSIYNLIEETDTYTLIAEKNWLRYKNINFIELKTYLNDEIFKDESIKKTYINIPQKSHYYWALSDIIRLYYLSKNINTFYCDTDVTLKYKPVFQNKVYFASIGNLFDYFMIYNGTNVNLFQKLLTLMINKYNYSLDNKKVKNSISRYWCFEIFNQPNFSKQITAIDRNMYTHLNAWTEIQKVK